MEGDIEVIEDHLGWYLEKFGDTETLSNLNEGLPAMDPDCRLCICIPAFQEQLNIYQCLWAYSYQTDVTPEEFEILVLVNRPNIQSPSNTEMINEIRRFMEDFPSIKIRVAAHTFSFKEMPNYGEIYKLVMDLALYRAQQGLTQLDGENLIIRASAADALEKHPQFISRTIKAFKDDEVVGYRSQASWPKEFLINNPGLVALDQLEERVMKHYPWRNWKMLGAFRAFAYSIVEGLDTRCNHGERDNLSRETTRYARTNDFQIYESEDINAIDNPRRLIAAGGETQNSYKVLRSYEKIAFERRFRKIKRNHFIDNSAEENFTFPAGLNSIFSNLIRQIHKDNHGNLEATIEKACLIFRLEMVLLGFKNQDFVLNMDLDQNSIPVGSVQIIDTANFLETAQKKDLSYFDSIPVFES